MIFRDATETDLPAIVHLLADDRFGAAREQATDPLPSAYAEGFRRMTAQGGRLIVAEEGGAVIACLQFNVLHGVPQIGQSRAQIEGVRVDSTRRGTGIGHALVQHAIAAAKAAGCTAMQLTTNAARTDAQRFYARLGFVPSHVGMKRAL